MTRHPPGHSVPRAGAGLVLACPLSPRAGLLPLAVLWIPEQENAGTRTWNPKMDNL